MSVKVKTNTYVCLKALDIRLHNNATQTTIEEENFIEISYHIILKKLIFNVFGSKNYFQNKQKLLDDDNCQ